MDNNQHDHSNNGSSRPPTVLAWEPMTQGELTKLRALLRESRVDPKRITDFYEVTRIEDVYYDQAMIILEKHVRKVRLRFAEIRISRAMSADDPTINFTDLPF
jgi:hypothetical protein